MKISVDKEKMDKVIAIWVKSKCCDCPLGDDGNCKKCDDINCRGKIEKFFEYEEVSTDEHVLSWQERGLLEIFSYSYHYIARDKNGELFVCANKPSKTRTNWHAKSPIYSAGIINQYFKTVQWYDEEPWLITDLLKLETLTVDWGKVTVDAKVLVRDKNVHAWVKRHFAKFENGKVFVYPMGLSSFTANDDLMTYKYVQLAKDDKNHNDK